MQEISLIYQEMERMKNIFSSVVRIIPKFNLTDPKILPYGLRPHTRSVSWIVEQVITQQTKYSRRAPGIQNVDIDMPDTCLHDCVVTGNNREKYYINVKITNANVKPSKNDIAAENCICNIRRTPSIGYFM